MYNFFLIQVKKETLQKQKILKGINISIQIQKRVRKAKIYLLDNN